MKRACSVFVTALLMLAPAIGFAQAEDGGSRSVAIKDVWARATPPRAPAGAVYLTLTSPQADRLVGVSSPAAGTASVHEMAMDGAIMRMRALPNGLELPAGTPVTLKPGGYHVMLEHLNGPLRQGQSVPLHLTFQKSPALDVTAQVLGIGANGPGMAAH